MCRAGCSSAGRFSNNASSAKIRNDEKIFTDNSVVVVVCLRMGRGQRHSQGARPLRRPGRGRRLGLRRRRVRAHGQKRKLQSGSRCGQPLRLRLRACGLRRSGGKGRGALFPPAARRGQILRFHAAPPCGRRLAVRVHRHRRSADMGAEGVCETRGGGRRHRRHGPQLRRYAFPRHLLRRHRVAAGTTR